MVMGGSDFKFHAQVTVWSVVTRENQNIGNTAPASPLPKLGDLMPLVEAVLIFVFVLLKRCQNLGRSAGMTKT